MQPWSSCKAQGASCWWFTIMSDSSNPRGDIKYSVLIEIYFWCFVSSSFMQSWMFSSLQRRLQVRTWGLGSVDKLSITGSILPQLINNNIVMILCLCSTHEKRIFTDHIYNQFVTTIFWFSSNDFLGNNFQENQVVFSFTENIFSSKLWHAPNLFSMLDPCHYSTFLQSRPDVMEVEAIRTVTELCLQYKWEHGHVD